jgi:putative endonuclease
LRASAPIPAKRAFVYIVRCADRTFYIGIAKDVKARLAAHNAGKGAKYTRPRLPVRVVFQEGPMSLTRALQREYQLKQLTRPQKQALIRGQLKVRRPR